MRVLDLGVCDAGIPLWIAQQEGLPLERIDGLDLDRNMIADARRRAREAWLAGTFVQDNALAAERHFEPHSYDAVVAFEIIEHVKDPLELLDVIERMLKPDGRAYLSTPDGTFGAGHNPHHLRVFRAVDLADLLRRRGRLQDMLVGHDGVVVASYTPGPRLEDVAIFCGPCWQPWSPLDIEAKGLGGSETAAVRLAEELSALGFVVTVYGEVEQCAYRDVIFRHWSVFDPLDSRGAVISSRIPEVFDRPVAAHTTMLWLHDTDCQDRLTPARAERIDHVLTLSPWHTSHVAGAYPFARERVVEARNGIHVPYFQPKSWEDRAQRVLYTSSPDRGLDVLLDRIWPRVIEQVPGAELHCCYPDVYDAAAKANPSIQEHRERILKLADQPGVHRLPGMGQHALAALMCDSRVWAHPSWVGQHDLPWHETSCIGAMEAQAAGCWVVASSWGALKDTVQVGARINSGALTERWEDAFVAEVVRGLTDPEQGAYAVTEGPKHAAGLGWDGVAEQVGKLIAAGDRR